MACCNDLDLVLAAPDEHLKGVCTALAKAGISELTLFRFPGCREITRVIIETLARAKGFLLVAGSNPAAEAGLYAIAKEHFDGPKLVLCINRVVKTDCFPGAPIYHAPHSSGEVIEQIVREIISNMRDSPEWDKKAISYLRAFNGD